jgi:myo-inositol-1(or 4)-monophosphatase
MCQGEWASLLEPIVRRAGGIILDYQGKDLKQELKADSSTVTIADKASEQYLIEQLTPLIQGAGFLAEESGRKTTDSPYCWVIDPLDGTSNFAHGLSYFCVSVGLMYDGQVQCGAIYYPFADQFFFAQRGKGAWCNGKRLQVSQVQAIERSFVVTALPYRRNAIPDALGLANRIAQVVSGMRYPGAIALDLAHVAMGAFDGALYADASWWDLAAGVLLVTEAGGKVGTFDGPLVEKVSTSCVAGNKGIQEQLVLLLN